MGDSLKLAGAGLVLGALGLGVLWLLARRGTLDPSNPANVVNEAANAMWSRLVGDPHQTIGGSLHDTLNPRAGLADNEYSPRPGVIVTVPRADRAVQPIFDAVLSPFNVGA